MLASMRFVSVVIGLLMAEVASVGAAVPDTLRRFDPGVTHKFYRDTTLDRQCARFDLAAPAVVREVVVWLGGDSAGTARVYLYSGGIGLPVPAGGRVLSAPLTVTKSRHGSEKIRFALTEEVMVDEPQFFVVVDRLSGGAVLLSDGREKRAACESDGNRWLYQALRRGDGTWVLGKFGYAIECVVEYVSAKAPLLANVTKQLGLPTSPASNRSITWGDIDGDTWSDVICGGRIFRNIRGGEFVDITQQSGIAVAAVPVAQITLDVENDGDLDVLFCGDTARTVGDISLWLNQGDGTFVPGHCSVTISATLRTFAVADANLDGYLDVFLGTGDSVTAVSVLLLNTGHSAFRVDSVSVRDLPRVVSAQWFDYDSDHDPDLYLTGALLADSGVLLNEDGGLSRLLPADQTGIVQGRSILSVPADVVAGDGGEWAYLRPASYSDSAIAGELDPEIESMVANLDLNGQLEKFQYRHWPGGATWVDVDNNGLIDAFIASSSNCCFARLIMREEGLGYRDRSFEYGLFRLSAGPDAVWVDYDRDGKSDLSTFVEGVFTILRNTSPPGTNAVTVDFAGATFPSGIPGAAAVAHIGDRQIAQTVVSGRGALMQGPMEIRFAVPDGGTIDSVVITYCGREAGSLTLRNLPAGSYTRPFGQRDGSGGDAGVVRVLPNPVGPHTDFHWHQNSAGIVRIDLFNSDGRLIATPTDRNYPEGDHACRWIPLDASGARFPSGAYVYRATIDSAAYSGTLVLVD